MTTIVTNAQEHSSTSLILSREGWVRLHTAKPTNTTQSLVQEFQSAISLSILTLWRTPRKTSVLAAQTKYQQSATL